MPIEPLTPIQTLRLLEDLDAKLNGCCLGLLELETFEDSASEAPEAPEASEDSEESDDIEEWRSRKEILEDESAPIVQFLHKSVPDFLRLTNTWIEILEDPFDDFDPNISILYGLVATLKIEVCPFYMRQQTLHVIKDFCRLADASTGWKQVEILDEVKHVMAIHHIRDPEAYFRYKVWGQGEWFAPV